MFEDICITNTTINPLRAVVIARVSSREQENGQSIDAQLENLRRYCSREHINIVKEFKITESSTRGERKKFYKIMESVKSLSGTIIIVADCVDRIQRSFKESIYLDDLMKKDKIELRFVRECLKLNKDSETTDISRWDFSVMAAKTYVGNLKDNVNRSMKYIREHGRWQHWAPLGYMNVRDATGQPDVVFDPIRAPMVKKLFELYSTGQYSLQSIADFAKSMGLTARRKEGRTIDRNSVYTFLKNPFYYGVMYEAKKYYPHNHPRLITKELFDKCQDVLKGRKVSPTKTKYGDRIFATSGLIKCTCGCSITPEHHINKTGKEYVYLKCSHYYKTCQQTGVNENVVLDQFRTEVFDKLYIPEQLLSYLKAEVRKKLEEEQSFNLGIKKSLEIRIADMKDTYKRVFDLYVRGKIPEDLYEAKNAELKAEEQDLQEQMARYSQIDKDIKAVSECVLEISGNLRKIFDCSKPVIQNQILRLLVSNTVLSNKKNRISLAKPFDLFLKNPDCMMWSGRHDSNTRHLGPKPSALPG